jgi:MFS family permease
MFPALAGIAAVAYGWRGAFLAMGVLGIIVSAVYILVVRDLSRKAGPREKQEKSKGWGIKNPFGFGLLTAIGVIDNSTRVGVLTFLPFLMADKGLDPTQVSLLLTLIFACGAAGKLGCGLLSDRFGNVGVISITETVTALATIAVVPVAPVLLVPVLVAFGFVLNGTSSALYTTVAEMVKVENRAKGYGLYYTVTLGSGIFAPLAYGALADAVGISGSFIAIAVVTLTTVPMAMAMRKK